MASKPVFQSSLGKTTSTSTKKDRTSSLGQLCLGKVIKVHHKRYTADVQLLSNKDTLSSSSKNEGRYACRIAVSHAGYDSSYKKPFGTIYPIMKGDLVIVGFLNNERKKPVILGFFHLNDEDVKKPNYKNILTSEYPLSNPDELLTYLSVSRIQDFLKINGVGNLELSSHTKNFLVFTEDDISDDVDGFDYEDLSVKDKKTKETIGLDESNWENKKFLAVFRDHYSDKSTSWLKLFVDTTKLIFRLTKMQKDKKLSMLEIDKNGKITLRRQLDSNKINSGSNYTELSIEENGDFSVQYRGSNTTSIKVSDSGIEMSSDTNIKVKTDKNFVVDADKMIVNGNTISTK